MKKSFIKFSAITVVFALGVGLAAANFNKQPQPVVAQQHVANYDEFVYEGTYYDSLDIEALTDGMNGTLRTTLKSLVSPKGTVSYSSLDDLLQDADEDPTNKNNMVYFYARDSVTKNSSSAWNKEHVWPRSKGNFQYSGAGADILHIRPTYQNTNSARGSYMMGNTDHSTKLTYNGMEYGYKVNSVFEPMDTVKGDVARIFMYLWTAYNGLTITNVIEDYDTLLQWHIMDRPDELERVRNDYSQKSNQKNRNPYVDHPEYAWMIFGESVSSSIKQECMDAYPANGGASKTLESITITGEATKKEYKVGESFNPKGLTVTANYSDESTRNISLTNCTWTPDPLTEGTTAITCHYGSKTATYSGITVTSAGGGGDTPPVVGDTLETIFKTASSDDGTELTASDSLTDIAETNGLFASINSASKVYKGKSGLKLGSSSNAGSITFALKDAAKQKIKQIEVVSSKYGTDSGTLAVKLGNTTLSGTLTPGTEFKYVLSQATTAETFTLSTSTKRAYVASVKFIFEDEELPPDPPIGDSSSSQPTSDDSEDESSIIPGSTSENYDTSNTSSNNNDNNEQKRAGCSGSVVATLSLVSLGSLIGLVFVFSKKK